MRRSHEQRASLLEDWREQQRAALEGNDVESV